MKYQNDKPTTDTFFTGLLSSLLIAVLVTLSACADTRSTSSQTSPDMKPLNTSVFYRERIMLPPGSIVTVTLEDVSRMDVKAEIVSKKEVETAGGPPYQVTLTYDPATLKEKMSYNLRAQIHNGDQLLFTSTERIDPFKQQSTDEIPIMVQMVAGSKATNKADSSLTDTYWELNMLLGKPVEAGAEGKALSMVLESEQNRVSGFSGCNNFSGTFTVEGNTLRFGQMLSTQMMCMEAMEQEFTFLQALSTTDHFTIKGTELHVYNNSGDIVARFVARYL